MSAAMLWACGPWLGCLVIGVAGLALTLRLAQVDYQGPRLWGRLGRLHRCDTGAVQSLSLVITLPMFLLFVLFIVQVSQLMIGTMVVHYAAWAAARAAIVWIPADVSEVEPANVVAVNLLRPSQGQTYGTGPISYTSAIVATGGSDKCQQVYAAAVLACAPIAPSRDLWSAGDTQQIVNSLPIIGRAYPLLVRSYPSQTSAASQGAIRRRLENKLAYSLRNTAIAIEWREVPTSSPDVDVGPTYNPRNHRDAYVITRDGPVITDPAHIYNPNEVGWEDTVTVWVSHRYALLPGPGRFLSKLINRADGGVDTTSGRIRQQNQNTREPLYTTELVASSTLTVEGFKSVIPAPIPPSN